MAVNLEARELRRIRKVITAGLWLFAGMLVANLVIAGCLVAWEIRFQSVKTNARNAAAQMERAVNDAKRASRRPQP